MAAKWEYNVTVVAKIASLHDHLARMAGEGWELVNGSAVNDMPSDEIGTETTRFVQYWKRPAQRSRPFA